MLRDAGRIPARNVFSMIRRFETPEQTLRSSAQASTPHSASPDFDDQGVFCMYFVYHDSLHQGISLSPFSGQKVTFIYGHLSSSLSPFSGQKVLARNGSGREMSGNLAYNFHGYRVLWHTANLRHGANGFTSLLNEGMLRIFRPKKSDGFGRERTRDLGYQRTACLPLDHRSRSVCD
jgi:hypothetical protein